MTIRILSIPCVIFLLSAGCVTTSHLDGERRVLLETDQAWASAAKAGDAESILSYWADDATNFFPGAPVARGKEALEKLVQRNRNQPGFSLSWAPEYARVAQSGELGFTYGSFKLSRLDPDGRPRARTGNYVCIWERQPEDGTWKCIVESTIFGP